MSIKPNVQATTPSIPTHLLEQALARAYLRPEMQAAVFGLPELLPALREKVAQVHDLAQPFPALTMDALFASLTHVAQQSDPPAVIQDLANLLRPGGRLVLVAAEDHPAADRAGSWLAQAGLVNRLLFDPQGQPARKAGDPVQLAVGARSVAGVHAAVQDGYGARAAVQNANSADESCCATGGCDCSPGSGPVFPLEIGYTQIELQSAPPEAAEIALGCGNPTAFAGLAAGETVLDIGSGGGLDSMLAARAVGPTGHVIGVDMTPAMLERARRSAAKANLIWVEYRQGQAEALPLDDDSVDVALSNCVINLSPDKGRVFEQIQRVLKPGGRLEISDMVSGGALPAALSADARQWAGCVAGALPEEEYLALIAQAGFEDIRPRRSPAGESYGGVPVYSLAVSARKQAGS